MRDHDKLEELIKLSMELNLDGFDGFIESYLAGKVDKKFGSKGARYRDWPFAKSNPFAVNIYKAELFDIKKS